MMDFREILSKCDLHDLGFSGLPWTYDNKQKGEKNVRVQLDRAVASSDWKQSFPGARVQHIVSSRSDHSPILLEIDKAQEDKT
jgi:exonuclease III